MLDPTKPLDESGIVRGWRDIAAVLSMSEDTAQRLFRKPPDPRNPFPVYYDYRGPYAHSSGLREWWVRDKLSSSVHIAARFGGPRRRKRKCA